MAQEPSRRVSIGRSSACSCWVILFVAEFAVLEAGAARGAAARRRRRRFSRSSCRTPSRSATGCGPSAQARYTTVEFSTDLAINAQGVRDDAGHRTEGAGRTSRRRARRFAGAVRAGAARRDVLQAARGAAQRRARAGASLARDQRRRPGLRPGARSGCSIDHVASAFQPDVVLVVAFVGNDAIEADRPRVVARRRRPPGVDGGRRDAHAAAPRRAREHGAAVRRACAGISCSSRVAAAGARAAAGDATSPIRRRRSRTASTSTRRAYDLIAETRGRATARGPALVLMPARFQTDDADYGRLAETVRAGRRRARAQLGDRAVRDGARAARAADDRSAAGARRAAGSRRAVLSAQRAPHAARPRRRRAARSSSSSSEQPRGRPRRADGLQLAPLRRRSSSSSTRCTACCRTARRTGCCSRPATTSTRRGTGAFSAC